MANRILFFYLDLLIISVLFHVMLTSLFPTTPLQSTANSELLPEADAVLRHTLIVVKGVSAMLIISYFNSNAKPVL